MSVNTAHANKGVVIYAGEIIILYCDNVKMEVNKAIGPQYAGSCTGRIYLTSHRIIFTTKSEKEALKSFASPFFALHKVELEQPVFGANYIKGQVKGQPGGGFDGKTVEMRLTFKHGGAIDFGQAMLKVASMANRHVPPAYRDFPPPYSAPSMPYAPAPPPAYSPPTNGYYGWVPPTNVFPDRPSPDGVYSYNAPPPYPGVYGGAATNGGGAVGFAPPPQAGFAPPPQGAFAPPQAGFNGMSSADAKAMEAQQTASPPAYCDPNQPNYAYVPPPAYGEQPPPYNPADKKTD